MVTMVFLVVARGFLLKIALVIFYGFFSHLFYCLPDENLYLSLISSAG